MAVCRHFARCSWTRSGSATRPPQPSLISAVRVPVCHLRLLVMWEKRLAASAPLLRHCARVKTQMARRWPRRRVPTFKQVVGAPSMGGRELTPAGVDWIDGGERSAIKRKATAPAGSRQNPAASSGISRLLPSLPPNRKHRPVPGSRARYFAQKRHMVKSADQPAAEVPRGHRAQPRQASAAGSQRIVCIAGKVLAHALLSLNDETQARSLRCSAPPANDPTVDWRDCIDCLEQAPCVLFDTLPENSNQFIRSKQTRRGRAIASRSVASKSTRLTSLKPISSIADHARKELVPPGPPGYRWRSGTLARPALPGR